MRSTRIFIPLVLALAAYTVVAGNDCKGPVIRAAADVTVSDGTSYQISAYYRSPDEAVISFLGEGGSDIISEGPYAWYRQAEKSGLAGEADKRFAIGHQYHGILLHFRDMMANVVREEGISFLGEEHSGLSADFPHGGRISLVDGEDADHPLGLVMHLPQETPIEVAFHEWLKTDGPALPYRLEVHHGGLVFTYAYTSVFTGTGSVHDFHERYPAPDSEEVRNYRARLAERCADQLR